MTIVMAPSLPPPVQQVFNEKILATPQSQLVHSAFATRYTMPDRSGTTMRMRRYERLQTSPVPIDPTFSNPPPQLLNAVDIDATIQWYGTYIPITRQVTTVNQDSVLNSCAMRLGQWLRETEDELIRDHLEGTASVINCTNGVSGDNPTEITTADCNTVVQTLQSADADFTNSLKGGENKFGTGPLLDAYFAMGHTDLITQLRNVNGFIEKAQYPKEVGVLKFSLIDLEVLEQDDRAEQENSERRCDSPTQSIALKEALENGRNDHST